MKTAHDLVMLARQTITECSASTAKDLLEQGTHLVLDVREPDEYAQGHLPGAVSVPRGLLEFRLSASPALQVREQPFLVYCKTGGRAALAVQTMIAMGYQSVLSVEGGVDAWLEQGLPIHQPASLSFE